MKRIIAVVALVFLATTANADEFFIWKNPGADPVVGFYLYNDSKCIQAVTKAINNSPMHDIEKQLLIKAIQEKAKRKLEDSDWGMIRGGDEFEWMAFSGGNKVVDDEIINAGWDANKAIAAIVYTIISNGKQKEFKIPLICGNVGLPKEKYLAIASKPKKREKKKLLLLIPPPAQQRKEIQPQILVKKSNLKFRPDFEATAFAGVYQGVRGNESRWNYWGLDFSFFPGEYKNTEGNKIRVGYSQQSVKWNGSGSGISVFDGSKDYYGAEGQYITGDSKTSFKVRLGEKRSHVSDGDYKADEEADMLNLASYHQIWDYNKELFPFLEFGVRIEIDKGGEKKSTYQGHIIPLEKDPRTNQSEYFARIKTKIKIGEYFTPIAEIEGSQRKSDNTLAVEPKLGVEVSGGLGETSVGYQLREGPDNDAAGISASISIDKALTRLHCWIKGKLKNAEKEAQK